MSEAKTSTAAAGGADILALLDARVRRIAEETYRAMSSDVGAVRVKTAARLLDMSESRVRALVAAGELKTFRPTPRTLRIALGEIRRYLEEHSSK